MRTAAIVALLLSLVGCSQDPGQIRLRIRWADGVPAPSSEPYYVLQARPEGEPLDSAPFAVRGPVRLSRTTELFNLPHGEPFVLSARAHPAPFANSEVLGFGASAPFTLNVGATTDVLIELRPEAPDTGPVAGPPPPDFGQIELRSAPWGTADSAGRPVYRLSGGPGALAGAGRIVVFDGPDADTAAELSRGTAAADGSFEVELGTDRGVEVYAAQLDAQDLLSDSSTAAGIQAGRVRRVHWTGALTGKLPGESFPNPHTMQRLAVATEALEDRAGEELSEAEYAAVAGGEGGAAAQVVRAWRRISAPATPRVGLGDRLVFDAQRGRSVMLDPIDPTAVWEWDGRRWIAVSPAGAVPRPRFLCATAYDAARGLSLLIGGVTEENQPLDDIWGWDGERWQDLTPDGPRPSARAGAVAVYDAGQARTLLFGGRGLGSVLGDAWAWDGRAWTEIPFDPSPRELAAAAYDPVRDRVVLVAGGNDAERAIPDAWVLEQGNWRRLNNAGPGRLAGAMVYDAARDRMVFWGGVRSVEAYSLGENLPTARWTLDPTADTWSQDRLFGEGPPPAFTPSMVYDPHRAETLIMGGGVFDIPFHLRNELWSWDGERYRHLGGGASGLGPGQLQAGEAVHLQRPGEPAQTIFYGGCDPESDNRPCPNAVYNWTGSGWAQRVLEETPPAAEAFAMAVEPASGDAILFGGADAQRFLLADTYAYDGRRWRRVDARGPGARADPAMAAEAGGGLIMFGGEVPSGELADTWRFRNRTWVRTATVGPTPPERSRHAMAYDPIRRRTVLFGGVTAIATPAPRIYGDLWEFDGTRWTEIPLPPRSPARADHTMVYDPIRQKVVIFGGATNDGQFAGDTFTWDGQTLEAIATQGALPPNTRMSASVYVPGEGVLITGGLGALGQDLGTWILAGNAWRQADAQAAVPSPRMSLGMTYVERREQVLLHGGCLDFSTCPFALRDMWSYDGYRFQPEPAFGAEPRGGHGLVEGPQGLVYAVGGGAGNRAEVPTATLDGADWQGPRQQPWLLPSSYFWTVAVRDPIRDRIFVVGGRGRNDQVFGDVYDWDPVRGSRPLVRGLMGRWNHVAAFDEARERLVVAGGCLDLPCNRRATGVWELTNGAFEFVPVEGDEPFEETFGARAVYDAGRGRVVTWTTKTDAQGNGRGDAWEWNGSAWRRIETRGAEPEPRAWMGLAYHRRLEEIVLFGGAASSNEPLGDGWVLPTSPAHRPGLQASFTLPVQVGRGARVTALEARAVSGGTGYATTRPGTGEPVAGTRLRWWDAWSGRWTDGVSHVAPNTAPAALEQSLTEDTGRRVDHRRQVHLRFEPLAGVGTGDAPPAVSVDAVELDVRLEFAP